MRFRIADTLKRILFAALYPAVRFAFHLLPSSDPWERSEVEPRSRSFGSSEDFRRYCLRESSVSVRSLDEVCEWLLGCEYQHDPKQSDDLAYWTHPPDFEGLRRGDCKDHSLWAWRKLNELGIEAELMFGQCRSAGEEFPSRSAFATLDSFEECHVWVRFQREGTEYLFETTMKDVAWMIRPLADVRAYYLPCFGVGPNFCRYTYYGLLCTVFGVRASLSEKKENDGVASE